MSEPILTLADVVVAFDALRAVDGVSLTVPRGQRRAIIGPNGAGKTTLFNAIAGALPPTGGRIMFDGHDITRLAPHRRARLGISRTFQITNLFPRLSVQDNMVLALRGRSPRKFSLFGRPDVDRAEAPQIAAALDAVRIAARADVMVQDLSYGEQRQLEMALSLVTSPRLLLLDEPAAGLSPSERAMVAGIIRSLDRDITIVLIEHDMDLALGLVDLVTCMFEGRVLVEQSPDEIRRNKQVQEVYLDARVMLEVRDLHSGYGEAHVVRGISIDVGAGEIVAVLGRNGMGKTTLIRSIMGLTPPQIRSGSITWRGESLVGLRPHDIAARKIAIVPQGRRLFPSLTVTEHLTMLKSVRARTGWTVDRVFGIFPRLAERRHHRGGQLSGGERGMLAVGRALMIDPQLILMDEPSEGLAPVMVQHLEEIVLDLRREGLSILLVEQNLYSALAVADRVYILETGQVVHQGDAAALAQQTDLLFQRLGVQ